MNLGIVVRKEELLQKRRFGDQDDADYQKDDDEEPVIEIKVFFTKSCVLRIKGRKKLLLRYFPQEFYH